VDSISISVVGDVQCRTGEGPVWNADSGRLLWVDIDEGRVFEATPSAGKTEDWQIRSHDLGAPVSAILPRAERRGFAVTKRDSCVYLTGDGEQVTFASIAEPADNRINDAKCDPRGRLWFGTLSLRLERGRGSLYRLEAGGEPQCVLDGVSMSNGMDWSPAGDLFYYADTLTNSIDVFDYDLETGTLQRRRRFVDFPGEYPDGLCVDAEGYVWVALSFSGAIRRYDPSGHQAAEIRMPVTRVTSCAFGGSDLCTLFVTTAAEKLTQEIASFVGLSADETDHINAEEAAGSVFACRLPVEGKPSTPFAG
jgi:sugar lactone lactonase YvrE